MLEDRQFVVQPSQTVKTAWIPLDACALGSRVQMDVAAIERAFRALLQFGDGQAFPPPNGVWDGERFRVHDGRHEMLAALALGRERLLVCWLESES
jgi:hypothetical protein